MVNKTDTPARVIDGQGDIWTRAEDGRYTLGLAVKKTGETTIGHIERNYGRSS